MLAYNRTIRTAERRRQEQTPGVYAEPRGGHSIVSDASRTHRVSSCARLINIKKKFGSDSCYANLIRGAERVEKGCPKSGISYFVRDGRGVC